MTHWRHPQDEQPPSIWRAFVACVVALIMLLVIFLGVRYANAQEPPTIAVIASVCLGATCHDVVVTTSAQDPNVTMMSCTIGQRELADWMAQNWPGYRLTAWKCVLGERRVGL